MVWLRQLLIAAAILTPLSGIAQTSPSGVAQSWEQTVVYVPGELNSTTLDKIKVEKPSPVLIFMHGCDGIGKEAHNWARLLAETGLLVILPDSLARTDRKPSCEPSKHQSGLFPGVHAMRLSEIAYAAKQVKTQPWFDGKNLFLMGFSEGATAVVRTKLTDFRGVIATSTTCTNAKFPAFNGVFVPTETPVLTLSHEQDPWVTETNRGSCADKISGRPDALHVTIRGKDHGTFHSEEARQAVTAFVKRLQQ